MFSKNVIVFSLILSILHTNFVISIFILPSTHDVAIISNNNMLSMPIQWHFDNTGNSIVPYLLQLETRDILCNLLMQYPRNNIIVLNSYPNGNSNCFTFWVFQLNEGYFNFARILLCPCRTTVNMPYDTFLVKGPLNRSVLMYKIAVDVRNYELEKYAYGITDFDLGGPLLPTINRNQPPKRKSLRSPSPDAHTKKKGSGIYSNIPVNKPK